MTSNVYPEVIVKSAGYFILVHGLVHGPLSDLTNSNPEKFEIIFVLQQKTALVIIAE